MLGRLNVPAALCVMAILGGCASMPPPPPPPPPAPPPPSPVVPAAGAIYRPVPIRSATASQFYYVKSETFIAAGATEAQRRQVMASRPSFGPFSLPVELNLMQGAAYDLVPRCGEAISWLDLVRIVIAPSTTVTLECR